MPKPSKLPTWATGAASILEPSDGKKAQGWVPGEQPPASFFNYWQNLVHLWTTWFDTTVDSHTTTLGTHTTQIAALTTRADTTDNKLYREQVRAEIFALCNLHKGAIPPGTAQLGQAAADPLTGRLIVVLGGASTATSVNPDVLASLAWGLAVAVNIQRVLWVPQSSRFIGFGVASTLRWTADGAAWSTITPSGSGVYGQGMIANNGSGVLVQLEARDLNRSTDGGVTWTLTTNALPVVMSGAIAYGAGLFVAPNGGVSNGDVYTSPDGVTWTVRPLPAATVRHGIMPNIAYLLGVGFVMLNWESATTAKIYQSQDGITWARTLDLGADIPNTGNAMLVTESAIYQTMGSANFTASTFAPDLAFLKDGSIVRFKMTSVPGGTPLPGGAGTFGNISYVRRRDQKLFIASGWNGGGTSPGEIWAASIGTVLT
jgi:hypothetical protein